MCRELEFAQWVTLFDEVDDDLYDGDLGEDDEESPKVMIAFKLIDNPTPTVSAPMLSQNISIEHQEEHSKAQSFSIEKSKTHSVNTSQVLQMAPVSSQGDMGIKTQVPVPESQQYYRQ